MKRTPGEMEALAGIVMFSFGGERSGRDLNSSRPELVRWLTSRSVREGRF
jgi:hypothetical protein